MSIRTNKMKAVAVLLRHVRTARSIFHERGRDESFDGKLEKLMRELNKINDLFMRVKKNEDELLDILTEVDGHLRKLDRKRLDEEMDGICKRIRDSAHKLLPMPMDAAYDDSSQDHNTEILHSHPSSRQHKNKLVDQDLTNLILQRYHMLEYEPSLCLLSLLVFPEHAVINKRHVIYWWIGEGFITNTSEKTAEEVGEDVIDQALKFSLIVPYGNGKCPVVNKFKLNPLIRGQLLSFKSTYPRMMPPDWLVLEQRQVVLGEGDQFKHDYWITVFNVGARYLNFGSQWMDKMKYLLVLQLGRWQDSPSHHIEVGSENFLEKLRDQKQLRYLSLRGISRISELPPSVAQLESLKILDLKACHNLETLPNDIASMKSLTHLNLSQCYLLEGMPKGIEKLTQLQVLKGFVIGSSSKTPCRISDLANLKKLKKLSIHIGNEAVIKDREFESLEELEALEHLKISWGGSSTGYSDIEIILPSSLKKLHLEGFPGQKIPEWLKPSKLPKGLKLPHTFSEWLKHSKPPQRFKELKLTGGKLESMNHDEDMNEWGMEILRLKYLKHLKVELTNLQELFPLLRYAEIKQILNHSYFEWSID